MHLEDESLLCAVLRSRQLGRKRHFDPEGDGVLQALCPLCTGFGSSFGTMREVGQKTHNSALENSTDNICF